MYWNGDEPLSGFQQNTTDYNTAVSLYIGSENDPKWFFGGYIFAVRYLKRALTLKEVKESYALAKGWTSYTGGVDRDAVNGFNLGLNGTVAKPIANTSQTAGYQWQLSWVDSVAAGTWTSRSYTFTDDFSSDSLLYEISGTDLIAKYGASGSYTTVATISRAATTFIDNVLLSEVSLPSTERKHGYGKYGKYGSYKK